MPMSKKDLEYILKIIETEKCTYKSSDRESFSFNFYIGKKFRKKLIEFDVDIYKSTVDDKFNSATITSKPYWGKPNINFKFEIKDAKQIKLINKTLETKGLLKGKKITYNSFTEYMNKLGGK